VLLTSGHAQIILRHKRRQVNSHLYGASAEYARHSLLIMVGRTDAVSVRDLARFQKLPERFLAKLFTRLEKAGLVRAIEGIRRGFALLRQQEHVSVMDILEAIDPDRSIFECAEIRRKCKLFGSRSPEWSVAGTCRIYLAMQEAEKGRRSFLAPKALADLGRDFERKAADQFIKEADNWFQHRRCERTNREHAGCRTGAARQTLCSQQHQRGQLPKNTENDHE
jgi:Rrf2 family protein